MAQIPLEIVAKLDNAIQDIEKFRTRTENQLEKIQASTQKISFAAIGTAAVIVGKQIIDSIGGAVSTVVDEASQAEEAINKLNISLKLSGSFSEETSKQMLELASSIQETTKFSDEAALGSITLAKNLGATNEQAVKITKAAANLSAVTGTDLDTATQALTKSLQGQGTQLQRMLPFLKGLTEEQLRSGKALEIVQQRFSGAAEALGNTFGGAVAKSKNAFSDFLENLGNIIIKNPIVINLINTFANVMRSLGDIINRNSTSIKSFIDTALVNMISGFGTFLQIIASVGKGLGFFATLAINTFRVIINGLNAIFNIPLLIGEGLLTVLIKPLSLALVTVLDIIKLIAKIPGISATFKAVGLDINSFNDGLETAKKGLFTFTKEFKATEIRKGLVAGVNVLADEMPKAIKKSGDAIDGLGTKIKAFAEDNRKNIGKFAKEASDAINNAAIVRPQLDDAAFRAAFQSGLKDVIGGFGIKLNIQRLDISAEQAKFLGAGAAVADALLKGAQGATKLLSGIVTTAVDALAPGFGQVAGQIFEVLSQSPEKVREMVTQFIQSIPIIFENIILSVPTIIEAIIVEIPRAIDKFIEEIPRIIDGIIAQLPHIVISLATMMPMVATKLALEMPKVAVSFSQGLIAQIPNIVKGFVDEIKNQVKSIGNIFGGGDGGGGFGGVAKTVLTGGLNKIFKFAEGGVVPGGFLNDTYPALLTSGEAVIDRSVSSRLLNFLDKSERGGEVNGSGTQNIVINLQVGEKELADVILQLNRNGFRTA